MATIYIDDEHTIRATITDVDLVDIALSRDGGQSYTVIATDVPVAHSKIGDQEVYEELQYTWTVTGPISSQCVFRITGAGNDSDVLDTTEQFEIAYPPLSIESVDINTLTVNGNFITETGKTVTVGGIAATVTAESTTLVTFTPATPLSYGTHVVVIDDGVAGKKQFTLRYRAGSNVVNVGIALSVSISL